MKKIEYQAPKMEVIKLELQHATMALITTSGETPGLGGEGGEDA